jgi:alpha-L-fucosidase
MFIHWGVYSVFANQYNGININGEPVQYDNRNTGFPAEWIMKSAMIPRQTYRQAAQQFDASQYNPALWVKTAKDAGMKYIIITAKHHDGFCLFNTQYTTWNAVDASAAQRNLLDGLVREARQEGLKIGFYYSQNLDWMHEGGMDEIPELKLETYSPQQVRDYVNNLVIPHFQELIDKYNPDVIWFDGTYAKNVQQDLNQTIIDAIKNTPTGNKIIFNDRLYPGAEHDFETPETDTPDIPYNGYPDHHNWEACSSLNNSWGYEGSNPEYGWKTPVYIISRLIELASKGGNYLLNVGPDPHGIIPQPAVNTLKTTGEWMKTNSEAIYGTEPNDLLNPFEYGYITQKTTPDGTFHWYLHISSGYWNENQIHLYGILQEPTSATWLDSSAQADMQYNNNTITINLPSQCPHPYYATIHLTFNQKPEQKPQPQIRDSLIRLTPYQAELYNIQKDFTPYALKGWYRRNSEVKFSPYLEAGSYTISSQYASINTGNFYITINNETHQAPYRRTNFGHYDDLSLYTTETFPDITINIPADGKYQLTVKRDAEIPNHYNIVNVRDFTLKKITSAGSSNIPAVKLFPNPVRDGILNCPLDAGSEITIYTISGIKIKSELLNSSSQINLRDLQSGTYILKSGTQSWRIIITR